MTFESTLLGVLFWFAIAAFAGLLVSKIADRMKDRDDFAVNEEDWLRFRDQ